ncbi:SSI family serine proteinase inhibitor [Kitasatospora sp. NPDC004240]
MPVMLAAATMALIPLAGPSGASEAPTRLTLSVRPGEADGSSAARTATLTCAPGVGGTHPAPEEACRLLDTVDGDPALLNADPGTCTMEYSPYTARAEGTYRGRPVAFEETYGNRCDLRRRAGALFDL